MWYSSSSCRLNQPWQIFLGVDSAGVKICNFYQKRQVAGDIVQPAITCKVRKHYKQMMRSWHNKTTHRRQHRARSFHAIRERVSYLLSNRGTERITPLSVPIHRRLDVTNRQLIRTKEKPRLPVPAEPAGRHHVQTITRVLHSFTRWGLG